MIIGIGSDLVDIRRIADTLSRFETRFKTRLFTDEERAACASKADQAAFLAKRFAAKEACAKALGTGFSGGIAFHEIEVVSAPSGQPSLRLTGKAAEKLAELTPSGHKAVLHLTLSDDKPYAQAFVVIEAIAPNLN